MLTIQFLEPGPGIQTLSPKEVVEILHRAGTILPITHVLIGWQLPEGLEEVCRKESGQLGAKFFRWQPYLTSDGSFLAEPDWQVENILGQKLRGYQNLPEFTHICPNNPFAINQALEHVRDLAKNGRYEGIFLDRIRFPSASRCFPDDMVCFCQHCIQAASKQGLDLELIREYILPAKIDAKKGSDLVETVFSRINSSNSIDPDNLNKFFIFRQESISKAICNAARAIHGAGLEVGLDCFSSSLANLVGQKLSCLGDCADWIKIMTYARTHAPAGIPFEYRGILDFLISTCGMEENRAIEKLEELSGIPFPSSRLEIETKGYSPLALKKEIERGVHESRAPILAGIELVDDSKVISLNEDNWQIHLEAIKQANPAGLSISWDLLKIKPDSLKMFGRVYNNIWK